MDILQQIPLVAEAGWLILPLYACSVIAVAIAGVKAWQLRRSATIPDTLAMTGAETLRHIVNGDGTVAIEQGSTLGKILLDASRTMAPGTDADEVEQILQRIAIRRARQWERTLSVLPTIVTVAPLLGLLGTVSGMIQSFAAIQSAGLGDPTLLAGGISVALYTTAAGLTVAVPVLLLHRWLASTVRRRVEELTDTLEMWLADLRRHEHENSAEN